MRVSFFGCAIAAGVLSACTDSGAGPPAAPSAEVTEGEFGRSDHRGGRERWYDVTITNLTTTQPFSPGVIATHRKRVDVFRIGAPASEGIRQIAENGEDGPAVAELTGSRGIFAVLGTGLPPVHRIGGPGESSRTFRIAARGRANRLSVAVMLICTNDGFTGVHGVRLPGGFRPRTFYTNGYDGGTEANDQAFTSIVDPCGGIGAGSVPGDGQNGGTRTPGGVITLHPGIHAGVGDLTPELHGWTNPVARITVQRVHRHDESDDDRWEGDDE